MSLNSGPNTKTASILATPTILFTPAAGERWNYIDVYRDTSGSPPGAEISFDSGANWLPFPGNNPGWSGPFAKTDNSVQVRPKLDGEQVTGLFALARLVVYQAL